MINNNVCIKYLPTVRIDKNDFLKLNFDLKLES